MNGTSFQSDIRYWLRQGNTVNHLLFWNIIVFLALNILRLVDIISNTGIYTLVYNQVALHASPSVFITKPWGLLTYMFAHVGILHILFNMLNLFWFGNIFREMLGNQRVLPVYLLGGIAGGLIYMGSYYLFVPAPDALMIGASASVMCLLVAAATQVPNYEIGLMFIGAIKLKWLALALVIIGVITMFDGNFGGVMSHLGGAALGFAYIKLLQNGTDLARPLIWLFSPAQRSSVKPAVKKFKPKKSPLKVVKKADENPQSRLDQLLDKINEKGYNSLSAEEKAWLEKMSKEK
ncbi:Membrane associated serine protease, rhomboid family [Chitinophaga jiangningensis]|uniref:Membrane associated serine protease, rhomboid family n=1 Tax=Chitinophaga jiangningensis TaxID=1419482 RepID=A0A1M6VJY5_9BACT|nr:rhomboid family intramembrane serine protease [Chitinophaga jiangningensis]SHK81867.1 Membrane associated serine protease, rhomboid family [Chitinophaga jiangningensis]